MTISLNWDTWHRPSDRPPRVLFVCTGNINRSAAAHLLAATYPDWEVRSAALNGQAQRRMSPKMRALLVAAGIDAAAVESFRSTPFSQEVVAWADLLVGFQPSHLTALAETDRPWASIARWLDEGVTRIADPNFDSSGALHATAVRLLVDAIPRLHAEVLAK